LSPVGLEAALINSFVKAADQRKEFIMANFYYDFFFLVEKLRNLESYGHNNSLIREPPDWT